ncbi:MAG TPA: hypothetical protein DCZ91_13010 [Lachnospiraceae bacterium]|nr:hypothetical protein [Lachnospiraceae bacterium]
MIFIFLTVCCLDFSRACGFYTHGPKYLGWGSYEDFEQILSLGYIETPGSICYNVETESQCIIIIGREDSVIHR